MISFERTRNEMDIAAYLTPHCGALKDYLPSGFNVDSYSAKISEYAHNYFLMNGGVCIGFISFYMNDLKAKKAFLSFIFVEQGHQNQGYGTMALNKVVRLAQQGNMNVLELDVHCNNKHAYDFYVAHGFSVMEQKELFF